MRMRRESARKMWEREIESKKGKIDGKRYTAPTDEALAFDVHSVKTFGLNSVRLHQKVNPERWYWYSDSLGVAIMQGISLIVLFLLLLSHFVKI
jgi:hypothetical protein